VDQTATTGETVAPAARPYSLAPPAECPLDEPRYFTELRSACPVSHVSVGSQDDVVLFTKYDDVKAILSDTRFSSNPLTEGFPFQGAPGSDTPIVAQTMIRQDPPRHTKIRKMMAKDFIPRAVEGYRPWIQATIDEHLDALAGLPQPLDFIEAFALPVPSAVISKILGVPKEDEAAFQDLTERVTTLSLTRDEMYAVIDEFTEFTYKLIELKEAHPAEDLMTKLTYERLHTDELTREELAAQIQMLVSAGHDTTAGMFGLSVLTLLTYPEQLELLKTGERSWEIAIEELIRQHTVVRMGPRRAATEDIDVNGQLIRKGQGVIASILSANHDEALFGPSAFADFSIPRTKRNHLGFGFGVHQCIGQSLARLELLYGLPALFQRYPDIKLVETDLTGLEFREARAFFGLRKLLVTL
jgi:cytochrome P450